MNLLAIDTSTDYLSIAIMSDERIVSRLHRKATRSHSSLLIPMIDRILKKANLKLRDLDGFSISIGPGSFTGLRIGVATVKGLSYSLRKPIVAVPTLDAIAQNANGFRGIVCPVLDAKKNKVYVAFYKSDGKNLKKISKYLLLSIEDLLKKTNAVKDDVLFLGDGVEQIFSGDALLKPFATQGRQWRDGGLLFLTNLAPRGQGGQKAKERQDPKKFALKDWHPRAEVVAKLGLERFKKKRFVTPEDLEPLYLYSKECDITGV